MPSDRDGRSTGCGRVIRRVKDGVRILRWRYQGEACFDVAGASKLRSRRSKAGVVKLPERQPPSKGDLVRSAKVDRFYVRSCLISITASTRPLYVCSPELIS
jgi:hypothetical protein